MTRSKDAGCEKFTCQRQWNMAKVAMYMHDMQLKEWIAIMHKQCTTVMCNLAL